VSEQRRFQLYGRRKAKPLRPRQQHLVDELLPHLRIGLRPGEKITPLTLFAGPARDVWLEIGFGGGEHLAKLASSNPEIAFIGAEPFINGVAKLLVAITDSNLTNIRIFDDDARLLLECLESSTIGSVFILYPDPWPKRRHEQRRLLNLQFVAELHRIMKPGAELRIASDSADYISWSLHNILRHGGFDWLAEHPQDWRQPPSGWIETRYESKALTQSRKPLYLSFRKLP
jgi:tRNA (guanine-N7-)-methyltransferase